MKEKHVKLSNKFNHLKRFTLLGVIYINDNYNNINENKLINYEIQLK